MIELLHDHNIGPLTLRRAVGAPVRNSFGEFQAGAEIEIELDPVAVHNLSGRDGTAQPEGTREVEKIEVYTSVALSERTDRLDYQLQGPDLWISEFVLEVAV